MAVIPFRLYFAHIIIGKSTGSRSSSNSENSTSSRGGGNDNGGGSGGGIDEDGSGRVKIVSLSTKFYPNIII